VRDAVNAKITLWVQELTSLDKAKTVINEKLPEIQAIAERVVADQGSNQSVKVKFGAVQFPTKLYGQFLYPAGEYQAILITLGEGKGANWWCVLYPPLCFLDFSNGVAVSDGFDEKAATAVKSESVVKGDTTPKGDKATKGETATKSEPSTKAEQQTPPPVNGKVLKDKGKKEAPVYTADDEKPVKVKFFVVELWHKIFE
jgi:stage II sporulation protein R